MDTAELVGGDAWQSKILEAIESSDGFVALISDHSVREGSCCYAEIEAALMSRTGPRIVPVIIKQDESSRGKPLRLLPLTLAANRLSESLQGSMASGCPEVDPPLTLLPPLLEIPAVRQFLLSALEALP